MGIYPINTHYIRCIWGWKSLRGPHPKGFPTIFPMLRGLQGHPGKIREALFGQTPTDRKRVQPFIVWLKNGLGWGKVADVLSRWWFQTFHLVTSWGLTLVLLMQEFRLTSWIGDSTIIYRVLWFFFMYLRWCRISFINSTSWCFLNDCSKLAYKLYLGDS